MATATDGFIVQNASATTAAFKLKGGSYGITVLATFNGGNVQVQTLAADGSTWLNVGSAITANSYVNLGPLPAGQYRLAITTATSFNGVRASEIGTFDNDRRNDGTIHRTERSGRRRSRCAAQGV